MPRSRGSTGTHEIGVVMAVPESYRGREQAFVKHELLRAYLKRLFMIIGQHQSSIRYVDCFSGPWQEGCDDLQDTSIGIALDIMQRSQEGLEQRGKRVAFKALFIEKDNKAFERLDTYLKQSAPHEVAAAARNGEFFDLRQSILDWCGTDDFTFFFIDPTGWKNVIEIPTLRPLLERPNSEFLINFMYDFVLRTHTQESFEQYIKAIFGDVPDTVGINPKHREECLMNQYRSRLKAIAPVRGGIPRTALVPILYPLRDRTLYHLVYLTRHPRGIEVFMDASEKLELVQRRVRMRAKQEHREAVSGQGELFTPEDGFDVEGKLDIQVVKDLWMRQLKADPCWFGIEELADLLEDTGWFESDFQRAFGELEREGRVRNLDASGRRHKKFIHFSANGNRGERLVRVKQ